MHAPFLLWANKTSHSEINKGYANNAISLHWMHDGK